MPKVYSKAYIYLCLLIGTLDLGKIGKERWLVKLFQEEKKKKGWRMVTL